MQEQYGGEEQLCLFRVGCYGAHSLRLNRAVSLTSHTGGRRRKAHSDAPKRLHSERSIHIRLTLRTCGGTGSGVPSSIHIALSSVRSFSVQTVNLYSLQEISQALFILARASSNDIHGNVVSGELRRTPHPTSSHLSTAREAYTFLKKKRLAQSKPSAARLVGLLVKCVTGRFSITNHGSDARDEPGQDWPSCKSLKTVRATLRACATSSHRSVFRYALLYQGLLAP